MRRRWRITVLLCICCLLSSGWQKKIEMQPAERVHVTEKEETESRELTEEEMKAFEEFFARGDTYGFLLSVYDTPADIDLHEVFYNGAGMGQGKASPEEKAAYEKESEWPIEFDFQKLTFAQVDGLLRERTGLSYEQMNHKLGWLYLPEYDAFYTQYSDTNYRKFDWLEGRCTEEGIYTLCYTPYYDSKNGYRMVEYEVVLEKVGEEYQFRSNRLMWERGLIEEQSFALQLEPLGDAVFASYMPDTEKNPFADVTFSILKDGDVHFRLKGVTDKNIRNKETFNKVEAVGFADYDKDGNTDIFMVISYLPGKKTGTDNLSTEIRIYHGRSGMFSEGVYMCFDYQEELSAAANLKLSDKTIRAAVDFAAKW